MQFKAMFKLIATVWLGTKILM
uniref:Uncharacterized protein n=1 Tax=Anguilla anguilla TaxID=7936 RepID=A0A0E9RCX5_ANGAN